MRGWDFLCLALRCGVLLAIIDTSWSWSITRRHQLRAPAVVLSSSSFAMELPISKGDGTVVDEVVAFRPLFRAGSSRLVKCDASLPLGVVLEEGGEGSDIAAVSSAPKNCAVVREVVSGTSGEAAGLRLGDVLRACTAVDMRMEAPTWQVLAGGIGRPKAFRIMYVADRRPLEEVLAAVSSNRMDPLGRPGLFVVERRTQ
mmetsp:Transcript_35777/g.72918  ORF Transcript_35777/g.72918 Transcript_35777/m.72918 type:complete len:200 (+) Transcript_35777:66-665(+)